MRWFIYFLISLPVALLGLLFGGVLGDACTRWYHISSFEGGAGFFVIGIALLGGFVGWLTSLFISAALGPREGGGYFKSFGVSVCAISGLALAATGICWSLADIPPEHDGRPLKLEVELRLPADVTQSPANDPGEYKLWLGSLTGQSVRKQQSGELRPKHARLEDGRWIIPGEVELFTTRGKRLLTFTLNGEPAPGFIAPVSAHPGTPEFEWSAWNPGLPTDSQARLSYRVRVQKIPEPPPAPTFEETEKQRESDETAAFEAIPSDAPISAWFAYTRYGAREDRRAVAITRMTAKPTFFDELSQLMLSEDPRQAEDALRLIEHLPAHPPELLAAVAAAGRHIAERIRKFNVSTVEQDPGYEAAADASIRFSGWMVAVRTLREKAGGDFTPELGVILELSRIRPDSIVMRGDICRVASFYMHEWAGQAPLPTDPKPR